MKEMKRVIGHWTGGAYGLAPVEEESYHFLIMQDGQVKRGMFFAEDNIPPLRRGGYAAHTRNCNSYSIGVAIDAMHGAKEYPFSPGAYPITDAQVNAYVDKVARLCRQYKIDVTRETVLTHAEVEPTLGIKQSGKWDITWLPGMLNVTDAIIVGDKLRDRIAARKEAIGWTEIQDDMRPITPGLVNDGHTDNAEQLSLAFDKTISWRDYFARWWPRSGKR